MAVYPPPNGAPLLWADLHRLFRESDPETMDVSALAKVCRQFRLIAVRLWGAVHSGAVVQAVGFGGHQRPPGTRCLQQQPVVLQELVEVLRQTADFRLRSFYSMSGTRFHPQFAQASKPGLLKEKDVVCKLHAKQGTSRP